MSLIRKLIGLSVLTGVLLAGCGNAPDASPATEVPPTLGQLEPAATDTAVVVGDASSVLPAETTAPTAAPPEPAATSRGPDLEATDPESVRLESGNLQLVEFFRFT